MTAHATLEDLALRAPWSELAEAAAPDAAAVDGAALAAYVADEAAVGEGVEAADLAAAKARLERELADASAEVDSYLGALARDPDHAAIVRTRTLDIALFKLFGGESGAPRYVVYMQTMKWLADVAHGRADLSPPAAESSARYEAGGGDPAFARASTSWVIARE